MKVGGNIAYQETCQNIIKEYQDKGKDYDYLGGIVAWPCVINNGLTRSQLESVGKLINGAVEDNPSSYYRLNTLGAFHYRMGVLLKDNGDSAGLNSFQSAIESLERSQRAFATSRAARISELRDDRFHPPFTELQEGRAIDWIFLAMAYWQLDQISNVDSANYKAKALSYHEMVKRSMQNLLHGSEPDSARQIWNRVELEHLYKELGHLVQSGRQ